MSRRRVLLNASTNGGESIDSNNYLTIEALEDSLTASLSVNACEYCVDEDGDWKTLPADTETELINGASGIPNGWTVVDNVETITFEIANSPVRPEYVTYQALKGMTWEEWINSEYNTGGFSLSDYNMVESSLGFFVINPTTGTAERGSNIIKEQYQYDVS